jgi:CBS domain-containing protein
MNVGEICTREVVHCTRDTSVTEIAKLMRNHHVGDLIVTEPRDGKVVPVGIVTDRDLVVEVLAEGVDPQALTAVDLMGGELVTAVEDEIVYRAILRMRSHGIRRLPIVDANDFLLGVLTVDDITEFLAGELSDVARILPRQMRREHSARGPLPT